MPHARCGLRVRLQHAPVAAAWLRCRRRERLAQLHRAHRADPGGTYLVCNAAHVPLAARSFDGILCLDVLEHVTNERAVLAETARLLKPGGMLVLTVPLSGCWRARIRSTSLAASSTRPGAASFRRRSPRQDVIATIRMSSPLCSRRPGSRRPARARGQHLHTRAGATHRTRRGRAGPPAGVVLFRWLIRVEPLYAVAAFAYYTVYLLEDVVPARPGRVPLAVGRQARRDVARSAVQPAPGHTQIDTAM